MPGADGLAVCQYIYETYPETQVIILSAYSEFEYARAAIKYGVCEYVLKIFRPRGTPGSSRKGDTKF